MSDSLDSSLSVIRQDGGGQPTPGPKTVILQFLEEDYFPPKFDQNSYRANIGNAQVNLTLTNQKYYFYLAKISSLILGIAEQKLINYAETLHK